MKLVQIHNETGKLIPLFAIALLVATLVRLALACFLELHFDEAYYWFYAQNPQLSYYDHPPMAAWFIRLGTTVLGDSELGVRLFGQIGALIGTALIFDATNRAYGLKAALFACTALQATLLMGVGSLLLTPDAPLLLFTIAMIWALVRLVLSGRPIWWLVAGAFGGAALLSKYSAGLPGLAILVWMLLAPAIRRHFATLWPWAAGIIAFAIFSPVLIWNHMNDWASFAKQGGRLFWGNTVRTGYFFEYVGGQFGLITPLLFILVMVIVWKVARPVLRHRPTLETLLFLLFFIPALFFLLQTPFMRVQGNWPAFMWPPVLILVSGVLFGNDEKGFARSVYLSNWARKLAAPSLIVGAVMVSIVWIYAASPVTPCIDRDPVANLFGKRELTDRLIAKAESVGAKQILTPDYAVASWLRFYAQDRMPIALLARQKRYLGFEHANPVPDPSAVIFSKRSGLPRSVKDLYPALGETKTIYRSYKYCAQHKAFFITLPTALETAAVSFHAQGMDEPGTGKARD